MQYDLIGDVHGHFDLLERLVEKLGYTRTRRGYEHREVRKLVFVGDLINRGPDSVSVLKTVKETWEEGNALVTLGNHEFGTLRLAFMNKPIPSPDYKPFLPWIENLPLFLDLDEIRVVHAAWHLSSIDLLSGVRACEKSFMQAVCQSDSSHRKAVDRILKGVKATLPGIAKDRFGIVRPKGRLRWWEDLRGKSFSEILFPPMYGDSLQAFPQGHEIDAVEPYPTSEKPVFVGHYCLEPQFPKVNGNVICLDGCVTCDKKLWGYAQVDGEAPSRANLLHS
ncbi:MAG TPA: hypothetical protein DCG39_11775 [Opitutae bacterium]|nr:hypothetical protein [Opitutae bacterium]